MEENSIGKDLRRIRRRIAAGKRAMLNTELKAEDLETAIDSARQTNNRLMVPQKLKKQ